VDSHEQQGRHDNHQVLPSQQGDGTAHQRAVDILGECQALPRHQVVVGTAITHLHQAPHRQQGQRNPYQPPQAARQQPIGRQQQQRVGQRNGQDMPLAKHLPYPSQMGVKSNDEALPCNHCHTEHKKPGAVSLGMYR